MSFTLTTAPMTKSFFKPPATRPMSLSIGMWPIPPTKGFRTLKTLVAQSQAVPVCWPDLIVLDVHMPFENGFEVLKFIRATPQLKRLPVVIFTGDTFPETREQSIALGANLFLLKPVNFQEIVELARSLYELMRQMKSEYSPPTSPSQ